MSSCSKVTFHGVNTKVFECLKAELERGGIAVPNGNSGTISGHGIKADFEYNARADTLSIQVTDKPFLVTCGYITGRIHGSIEKCGGAS